MRLPDGTDPADNAQLARERSEAWANQLEAALCTVEACATMASPRALGTLTARVGRAYARALARLQRLERDAVRKTVRRAKREAVRELGQ